MAVSSVMLLNSCQLAGSRAILSRASALPRWAWTKLGARLIARSKAAMAAVQLARALGYTTNRTGDACAPPQQNRVEVYCVVLFRPLRFLLTAFVAPNEQEYLPTPVIQRREGSTPFRRSGSMPSKLVDRVGGARSNTSLVKSGWWPPPGGGGNILKFTVELTLKELLAILFLTAAAMRLSQ